MALGERISDFRKNKGISQEELSQLTGINRVTIARYETNKVDPSANSLLRIAIALDVSVDVLLGREESIVVNKDTEQATSSFMMLKLLPIISERVSCDFSLDAKNVNGYTFLPIDIRADYALVHKGESMFPTFINGDLLFIKKQCKCENSSIVVIQKDKQLMIKRVYKQDEGYIFIDDNIKVQPIHATDNISICGQVVGLTRFIK